MLPDRTLTLYSSTYIKYRREKQRKTIKQHILDRLYRLCNGFGHLLSTESYTQRSKTKRSLSRDAPSTHAGVQDYKNIKFPCTIIVHEQRAD